MTLLAIGLPAAIGLIVLARPIAEIVVGERFRAEAALLIPLIVVAALLRDLKAYYLDLAFYLGHRTARQLWVTVIAAVASVLLNLVLIPIFGIYGAAYGAIATYSLALVTSGLLGREVFALPGPGADDLKVALAAAGMGLALWLLAGPRGVVPLLAQIAGGALVYAALLCILNAAGARIQLMQLLGRGRRQGTF